jgi:hypothetical protein
VFENRLFRRILAPRRYEVTRQCIKLHNEELNDLYFSTNILRVIQSRIWEGHVARRGMGEACTGFWWGSLKRPLGRPSHRWEDNSKMNLQEVECGGMDWIDLAQDRDRWRACVSAVMNLRDS